jgi:hypothetical protein
MQIADREISQEMADTLRELAERCAGVARSCPDAQAQTKLRELAGELAREAEVLATGQPAEPR